MKVSAILYLTKLYGNTISVITSVLAIVIAIGIAVVVVVVVVVVLHTDVSVLLGLCGSGGGGGGCESGRRVGAGIVGGSGGGGGGEGGRRERNGRNAAHHDGLGAVRLRVVLEGRLDFGVDDLEGLDHALQLALHRDHALHIHAHVVDARDGHAGVRLLLDRVDYVALFADDAADVVVVRQHFQWGVTVQE